MRQLLNHQSKHERVDGKISEFDPTHTCRKHDTDVMVGFMANEGKASHGTRPAVHLNCDAAAA